MNTTIVRTQAELDTALAEDRPYQGIEIRSERGVWLELRSRPKSPTATVTAYGSATATATDSATVTAYGSATVRAYDSATVRAYDSATVTAYGSATVRAYDSATVRAYDSATVTATGSATVTAYDSATVTATPKVAVHLHSARVKTEGGVVIDVSKPPKDGLEWCEYHGVKVDEVDGQAVATVYKAVSATYVSGWGQSYAPGTTPVCHDWRDNGECGNGFHFSPTPTQALAYFTEAKRFLAVGVLVEELRPLDGGTAKCKAKRVFRACVEVDEDCREVTSAQAEAAR